VLGEATVRAMTHNQTGLTRFGSFPGVCAYDQEGPRPWGFGFALQTPATPGIFSDLASFSTFGHGGATGCEAFVDPEHDISIVVTTNTHLRTGIEAWFARLQALSNAMMIETTARR
jgi:CubicO group peptidase (beta-lactamase class C family)